MKDKSWQDLLILWGESESAFPNLTICIYFSFYKISIIAVHYIQMQ